MANSQLAQAGAAGCRPSRWAVVAGAARKRVPRTSWKIPVVMRDLLEGTRRFSELRSSLAGISPKTLTDRLRELEQHGLVERVMYAEIPPRVEYTLTQKGRTLEPVISALAAWGRGAGAEEPRPPGW